MPFKCNLSINKHKNAFSTGSKLIVPIKRHFYCMEAGECEFNRNCIYAKWVWIKFLFGNIFLFPLHILSPLHNTISIFSIWHFCVYLECVVLCVYAICSKNSFKYYKVKNDIKPSSFVLSRNVFTINKEIKGSVWIYNCRKLHFNFKYIHSH